jgi:hypothetical protein
MDELDYRLSCVEDRKYESATDMEGVFKRMMAQETLLQSAVIRIGELERRVDTVCHDASSLLIRNLTLGFTSSCVSKVQGTYLLWSIPTGLCSRRFRYLRGVDSVRPGGSPGIVAYVAFPRIAVLRLPHLHDLRLARTRPCRAHPWQSL